MTHNLDALVKISSCRTFHVDGGFGGGKNLTVNWLLAVEFNWVLMRIRRKSGRKFSEFSTHTIDWHRQTAFFFLRNFDNFTVFSVLGSFYSRQVIFQ